MSNLPNEVLSAAKLALAIQAVCAEQPGIELLHSQPIAVVGIGCRFPGGVRSADGYWHLLHHGENAISEIPADRWDAAKYYSPDQYAEGKMNTRWGGFLDNYDQFDPSFFRISPREASAMDPQQRLVLEVAWEALWDAGIAPDQLAGSSTGVFLGLYGSDYARLLLGDAESIDPYTCAGVAHSMASGRISFMLDLHGPSLSIDTACSSSLIAVHQAVQSIRAGSCRMAVAGGVSLKFRPEHYLCISKLGMTSPEGRCRTFDAGANGFVPGEGCGIVFLKPLIDALKDKSRIYAVIRGAAANHNGRTSVVTAPSGLAQRDVIRAAIANARISPADISFVETHGTGTALGDPIEVEALAETIGTMGLSGRPCALGSVKTNIGHLEAASGIAGFIKACLALHHNEIPPNLHFEQCNPHVVLKDTRFFIPVTPSSWPPSENGRFAGVSAFGFSGTNAHVVLEEAPRMPARLDPEGPADTLGYLLPISARTPEACSAFARSWRDFLGGPEQDRSLYQICHGAAVRRSHYEERLVVTAASHAEMCARLNDYLEGRTNSGVKRGRAARHARQVVFVFSGQGLQWAQMGLDLYLRFPVFRASFDECENEIRACAGWSIMDVLSWPESKVGNPVYAQPAHFALQVALAKLWQSWGIAASSVLGSGIGDVAASHIAGILSLESAARIAMLRGILSGYGADKGKVAIVHQGQSNLAKQLGPVADSVSIVYVNSPRLAVVGGEIAEVDALVARLRDCIVESRPLRIDCFSNESQMQECAANLFAELGPIPQQPARVPMISTVTGGLVAAGDLDTGYWVGNLLQPALLAEAVRNAEDKGAHIFLGIGPHPVLPGSIAESMGPATAARRLIAPMPRDSNQSDSLLSALGEFYVEGFPVAWDRVYTVLISPVTLPSYPYQRKRIWH